jgi:hypothetical protein
MTNKSGKKKSKSTLAAFDMFGSPVAFNIAGDETYKTVVGCFSTVIVGFSVLIFLYIYLSIYYNKTSLEVTTELLIQDEYPLINFVEQGFFFSIYATKDKKITKIEELNSLLKFEAFQTVIESEEVDGERGPPTVLPPTLIPFGPCASGGRGGDVNGNALQGKKSLALSDNAYCSFADADKPMYVQGNEDSDTYAYVRMKIMPCDATETDCLFYHLSLTANSPDQAARCAAYGSPLALAATKRPQNDFPDGCTCAGAPNDPQVQKCDAVFREIRDYIEDQISNTYFTFNYVEGAVVAENYEEPFEYSMKSTIKTYGSIEATKLVSIYFRDVVVNTDVGFLQEVYDEKHSVNFDLVMTDFIDRGEGKAKVEKRPDGTEESTAQSYIEFTMHSSNNQIVFNRKYDKMIDVFASVGGIAEVVAFTVIFFYAWYNGIKMEQKLLNFGVLGKSKESEVDEDKHTGQVNEDWEKTRYFSFRDLVCFGLKEKGLCCCCKKGEKFEFYQKTKETYEQRTDVINIMKAVADVDTIKDALFEDYQIRLMPYIVNQKSDDDSDVATMTVMQALNQLNDKKADQSHINKALDDYLKTYLPDDFLNGNLKSMSIGHKSGKGKDSTKILPLDSLNVPSRTSQGKSPKASLLSPSGSKIGSNRASLKSSGFKNSRKKLDKLGE